MRRWRPLISRAAILLAVLAGLFSAAPVLATSCDRACLTATMGGYLAHLAKGDPTGLRLAKGLVARENGATPTAGEGAWALFQAIKAGQTFADASDGQVFFMGVGEDKAGRLVPLVVRLKVGGGRIAESEIIFNPGPAHFYAPAEMLHPDVLYDAALPPDRRSSRGAMIAVVDRYFDAMHSGDGASVPLGDRCDKYYAGAKVTNAPGGLGTCLDSFSGLKFEPITDRRFPVVDPQRGVVAAIFVMAHDGHATLEAEVYKIVDGQIRSVDELGHPIPYPPAAAFPAAR